MIVLAGLMGASGIILAAAAAHAAPGAGLDSAAYMLLLHATAVLSGAALLQQGLLQRPLMLVVPRRRAQVAYRESLGQAPWRSSPSWRRRRLIGLKRLIA